MIRKDVLWHFQHISGMCVQWCIKLILVRYWSLMTTQFLFSKDSRHWFGFTGNWSMNPKNFPSPTMFITSSLLLLITKLKEYQDSLVTGQMFTPVNKTYQGPLLLHGPMQCGHSTHEDVQKENMSNYSRVFQRRMVYKFLRRWQSFLFPLL